jgi:uncharacterized membrane protein (UPF0127 family)
MQQRSIRTVSRLGKYLGLMFRSRNIEALLFNFQEDTTQTIHSWFVFFPFKAIWYDAAGLIIEERIVQPFQSGIRPAKPYRALLEIPI